MRALVVVNLDKVIEAVLLLKEVIRGRFRSFLLQRGACALASILLVAGLDALEVDAKAQPLDR
jgi:hypothetical protein